MQAEQSILDRIKRRQLKWYGHFLRMEDSGRPNEIYQWTQHSRRRRGIPQQSWKNEVADLMRSRNTEKDMAEARHLWPLAMDKRLLAYYKLMIS